MRRIIASLLLVIVLLPVSWLVWLVTTESGLHWTIDKLQPYIGGQLHYKQAHGQLVGPIVIKDLEYRQTAGLSIVAKSIRLDWQPRRLFKAHLNITELTGDGIAVELPVAPDSKTDVDDSQTRFEMPSITLPIDISLPRLVINNLTLVSEQPQLIKHIAVDTEAQHQQVTINRIQIEKDNLTAVINGSIRLTPTLPHQLNLEWLANATEPLNGHASLTGDLNQAKLVAQTHANIEIDTTVTINTVLTEPSASFKLWAKDMSVDGTAQWLAQNSVNPLRIDVNWSNLHWPIQGTAEYSSHAGNGWLQGDGSKFQLGLTTSVQWSDLVASIYTSGTSTTDNLTIEQLRIETLGGEISATGKVDWRSKLNWQSQIDIADINPGTVWPQWPGRLDGQIKTTGTLNDDQLNASLEIREIDGDLRDYPVSLQGHAQLTNETVDIPHLKLTSEQTQLVLNGHINDQIALNWSLNSPDIGELIPDSKGIINATGQVTGDRQAPTINAEFNAQTLTLLSATSINTLQGQLAIDTRNLWQPILSASALGITHNTLALQALGINSDEEHITLAAVTEDNRIDVTLNGKGQANGWQGQLVKANINSGLFGDWHIFDKAALVIKTTATAIEPICLLSTTYPDSRLCLDASFNLHSPNARTGTSNLLVDNLPLSIVDNWLPQDSHIDGVLNGTASASLAGEQVSANGQVELPKGYINIPIANDPKQQWTYDNGIIEFSADDRGIQAKASMTLDEVDQININMALPGADIMTLNPEQQIIDGSARMSITRFDLIDSLVTQVHDLKGTATVDVKAAGTLAEPEIIGRIKFAEGQLQVQRLGLNVRNVTLTGETIDTNQFRFNLDATSGKGILNIVGDTRLEDDGQWPTKLTISGQSVEVSHIPEAHVLISPDISINIQHQVVSINGNVDIPFANLKPKDISTAAQTSSDAVIISTDNPDQGRWTIDTHVKVTLGDKVYFFGFGYEGRFGGTLEIQDQPGQLTTAIGELSAIDGRYRAYGQRLDIEQGRILFTGGPISNPGLDLRAVRHIGEVTAGIKVLGSLRDPQIELFSIPTMGQTDALSYLLLGRTLETSTDTEGAMMANAALALGLSGGDQIARTLGDRFGFDEMRVKSNDTGEQASLVIGRYLSPKLYISYGVGIIDAYNTFNVRYQISDKWQLKGENGEYQGADLLYTIER